MFFFLSECKFYKVFMYINKSIFHYFVFTQNNFLQYFKKLFQEKKKKEKKGEKENIFKIIKLSCRYI